MSERRLPACLSLQLTMTIHRRIKHANEIDPNFEWHSRGYLPHFDSNQAVQFITYRLADSLPSSFMRQLKFKLDSRQISEVEYYRGIEKHLDLGKGVSHMRRGDVANMVEENLLRFDGEKYQLLHWVIMYNHVHLLLRAINGHSLSAIMHSMKSFTANRAKRSL